MCTVSSRRLSSSSSTLATGYCSILGWALFLIVSVGQARCDVCDVCALAALCGR